MTEGIDVYVATCDTRYEVMGVGATREEAIRVTGKRALAWLKSYGTVRDEVNTVDKVIEYFGIADKVEKIKVGTAVVIGQGEQE